MRKNYEDKLIELIRAVVIDRDSARAAKIVSEAKSCQVDENASEYDCLCALAAKHQLSHFVEYAAYAAGFPGAISDFYTSVSITTRQAEAAREISSAFSGAGIKHVPLKGTVVRSLYPEGWMRNSCDVDVLVSEAELERAAEVLVSLGYEQHGEKSVHDIPFLKDVIHIELHYKLIEDDRMSSVAEALAGLWDKLLPGADKPYSMAMNDETFYLYHIAHTAKHFGDGGCGIRPVLDIWMLNNRCVFDKSKRMALIEKAGLKSFEDAISRLSEYWFGSGTGDGLCVMENYILSGGAYGNLKQKIQVKSTRQGRLGYVLHRAFMPYGELSHKYPVLKKHPCLFPVLTVWRWHEFFGKNRKGHVRELKDSFDRSDGLEKMIFELGLSSFS